MLAVCGGGGSDGAALLLVALVVAAWVLVAALVIRRARDSHERKVLIALTLFSSLAGPAVLFGLFGGLSGDNDQLPQIVTALSLPGLVGACIAAGMQTAHAGRAFFLAFWGAVFLVGVYVVLVLSVLLIGTACLS